MDRDRAEEGVIGLSVQLYDGSWCPIPGYEGVYFINKAGEVCNIDGHIIKQTPSRYGLQVELRKNGQRDRIPVEDLIERVNKMEGCNNEQKGKTKT